MPGAADPEYASARRVLLDALEALASHQNATILVGAHAVYLHAGEADLAVAPFTTDGDLALDPRELGPAPTLEDAMLGAGFAKDPRQPGVWVGRGEVVIDLLVPESLGGEGRRGARLGPHGTTAARKARGLEAAVIDNEPASIRSLDDDDGRQVEIAVAGPGALLVAKLHKIDERSDQPSRSSDKDALDVLRLLRAVPVGELAARLRRLLIDPISSGIASEALQMLARLFGTPDSPGARMAARAAAPLEDPDTIAASCAALAGDLLDRIDEGPSD